MTKRLPDAAYRLIGRVGNNRVVSRLHPLAYRMLGGRGILGRSFGMRSVILTTTGRRTGRPRATALFAQPDGDRWVVAGTRGGSDTDPAWIRNLRVEPRARLRVGARERPVRARETDGPERERLWARIVASYPGYDLYQRGTTRRIPVIVLEPDEPSHGTDVEPPRGAHPGSDGSSPGPRGED